MLQGSPACTLYESVQLLNILAISKMSEFVIVLIIDSDGNSLHIGQGWATPVLMGLIGDTLWPPY